MMGELVSVEAIEVAVGATLQAPSHMLAQLMSTRTRFSKFIFTCKSLVIQQRCPQFSESYDENCGHYLTKQMLILPG